jgi:predicted secreted Zn-dependent protease
MPNRIVGLGKAARIGAAALLAVATVATTTPGSADVRTTTATRAYVVGGTTASGLVSYMRSHPFPGDYGNAVANIRPSYSLTVGTSTGKGGCSASNVSLRIHFTMTLPRAKSTSGMAASTRSAWNSFAAYARQHEETHRRIYVACANSFIAKARKVSGSSCSAVQATVRRLLEAEKRSCEAKNRAYDRAERSRVASMSLFRMASSRGKR